MEPRTPEDSAGAAKAALRARLLRARGRRDPRTRAAEDAALVARALSWVDALAEARGRPLTLAAHAPAGTEPAATADLVAALAGAGAVARLLLPVCPPGPPAALHWARFDGRLTRGRFGLAEPAGPAQGPAALAGADAALLPGLAADRAGMRLGRGAGYYDRSLAVFAGATAVLLHPPELLAAVPHDRHDRPVGVILTAAGAVRTAGASKG
ncbi:5-formyltetrahydrofolate cyclo-ligase [Corynebacterium sphenisci]|uniref:5-formyltetrahydrofolate cyclo-ligase n=1 Tax=Corynebacterium sphenisci TaxID=191493 RepID=UPI0026E0D1BA|nr:5-formyltetrahydrofolate cyclo-ligase [Corynebacterium sphenisci]MDO5731109.1 5-formyltetrahydrofolate cyclo-ligase [Corynebacterium sphenisci]